MHYAIDIFLQTDILNCKTIKYVHSRNANVVFSLTMMESQSQGRIIILKYNNWMGKFNYWKYGFKYWHLNRVWYEWIFDIRLNIWHMFEYSMERTVRTQFLVYCYVIKCKKLLFIHKTSCKNIPVKTKI